MKAKKENVKSSPILSNLIGMSFDLVKHVIKDFEQARSVKKIDKFNEQFSTIEHLLIKLESKVDKNRKEIHDLKTKLLVSSVISIALSITILLQIIL